MSRDVNGSGLTRRKGLVNGMRPRPQVNEVVQAALLTRRVPVHSVSFRRDLVIIKIRTEDVVAAAYSRPARKQRVVLREPGPVEEPFELLSRTLPATGGSPRWW